MQLKNSFPAIVSVGLLISGNMVGVGILGLPVKTGVAGFVPAVVAMVVACCVMSYSAVVLSREAIIEKQEEFNFPSLFQKYLGHWGKWIATVANMIVLYGLLVAYLAAGSTIIGELLKSNSPWVLKGAVLGLFIILSSLALGGMAVVKRCNTVLIILMWLVFVAIICIASKYVQFPYLEYQNWKMDMFALPILFTAFLFHNIIPNICHHLKWDMKSIGIAIGIGMSAGFLMNFLWIMVAIGDMPLHVIDDALRNSLPATVPMSKLLNSSVFVAAATLFAIIAIVTSYISNGLGLMGFVADLVNNTFKVRSRLLVIAITFLPPLMIALINPDIFLKAIDIVGGVGIVILFGILPAIITFKKPGSIKFKVFSVFCMLVFILALVCVILKMAGVIKAGSAAIPGIP